jgi:hypothetical protein
MASRIVRLFTLVTMMCMVSVRDRSPRASASRRCIGNNGAGSSLAHEQGSGCRFVFDLGSVVLTGGRAPT